MFFSELQSLNLTIIQLAKASTLALLSMVVILVAVLTQGFRVSSESRGEVKSLLFVNSGFFQAVGVISFGKSRTAYNVWGINLGSLIVHSICLPYVIISLSNPA